MSDVNKDHISVKWEKPKSDGGTPVTGYIIDICCFPSLEFKNVAKVDGDVTTFTADGLSEGGKYYLRVRAENDVGLSEAVEFQKPVVAKLPFGK